MSSEQSKVEGDMPSPRAGRVVFIDVLRLVAAFQMVQGHTLDAILDLELRTGWLFDAWQRARGLTAVSFLFAAGLAFQRTTLVSLERYLSERQTSGRRLGRLGRALRLIALGYVLHAPLALLFTDDAATRALVVRDFLSVDVLQCIGVSLITLELLVRVLKNAQRVALAAGVLGALAIGLSPMTHAWPVEGAQLAWLGYFSPQGGSIFPLLPWAGHLWLGVGIAQWSQARWSLRLWLSGAALAVIAWLVTALNGPELIATHSGRLGAVAAICAGLSVLTRDGARLPAWLEQLTGETLAVYVFHILLVYGAGVGLAAQLGPTLSVLPALAVTGLVMLASLAVALGFHRFQARPGLAAATGKR